MRPTFRLDDLGDTVTVWERLMHTQGHTRVRTPKRREGGEGGVGEMGI